MKLFWTMLIALGFSISASAQRPLNAPPQVLASIHPLALVAASVVPEAQLQVLLPSGMTPHDFSLRPSDIDRIQSADIIFWAGAETEPYLAGFVKRWPEKQWLDISHFALAEHPDTPAAAATHEHEQHGHHHAHGQQDPHWWFSSRVMLAAQAQLATLLRQDPQPFAQQVNAAIAQAQADLAPLRQQGFLVFHQAYDHWVESMGLNQLGAFTLSPERKPGARTLQQIRTQLSAGEVACVFSEPQFSPSLVESVTQGINVNRGELDPMAYNIPIQADGYVLFIQDLTARFVRCLGTD